MYIPDDKMDINKFRQVAVPEKSQYMARYGMLSVPASMFTGDEFAPLPKNKVDSIADMERYDEMMAKEDAKNQS